LFVAGCALVPSPVPASFLDYVESHGATFAVSEPHTGEMTLDEAVATARGERDFHAAFESPTPLDATFGTVTCPDAVTCRDAFSAQAGEMRLDVWVVGSLSNAGPDAGRWLAVNAVTGFYSVSGPD